MGRLVKANPTTEASKSQTTVVGTGAHGRLVRTGDVQRTSPAGNTAKQPTIYQQALDAAAERANELDKLTTPSASRQERANEADKNTAPSASRQAKSQTLKGRIKNTAKGAAKTYAAGLVNIAGVAQNSSGLQRREEANTEIALWDQDIKAQRDVLADPASTESERDTARNVIAALEARKAAYLKAYGAGGETERTVKNIYKAADRLNDSGGENIERAKQGLGTIGQLAVDVGVAGAQMGADAALGLLTGGSALPAMFVRSTGGSAQEARRAGATHEQQVNYGFASGALSVATEKIGNAAAPFKKMFGKGFLDNVIEKATQNLTRSAAGKIALSFLEEGGEEVLEDLIQPALQTIYNGKSMGGSYSELEAAEVLNDFLVGGILGGLGGAVEAVQRRGYYGSGTKLPDAQTQQQAAEADRQGAQMPEIKPENTPQAAVQQQSAAPEQDIAQSAAPETTPQQVISKLENAAPPAAAAQEAAPQQVESGQNLPSTEESALDAGKRIPLDRYATKENADQVSQQINDGTLAVDAQNKLYRVDENEHIDRRDSVSVGDRKVNAFQFDHPELHQYFADAAADLAEEMSFAQPGGELVRRTSREAGDDEYIRTKRGASERVARLLDDEGVRYEDIDRSISAIIHNHGQENFAAAKRVELLLDEMLTNGYTDIHGRYVAPNEAYIAAKREIPGAAEATAQTREELPIYDMPNAENGGIYEQNEPSTRGAEPAEVDKGIDESGAPDAARTLSDGDAKRGERGSTGRETERVPKEVRNVGGEDGNALTVQKRIAASGISQFISPREAKVPNGAGGENTVTIFNEADWDQELISAANWAKSKGVKKVTALLGVINVEKDGRSGSIFGAFDADTGEIFVNASSMQRSVSETIEHETAHYLSEMARRENVRAFMRDIQSRYSSEEWSKVYDAYFDRYAGITGDYAGMNESDIELYVWEEIMGDAYAEIDQYEQRASRFNREAENALTSQAQESETTSQISPERTAVQGRETAAATERRTGPPERYSYAGKNAANANHEARYEAERLEMQGVDAETIRQMTGWFRGADRKWRFETDDSGMKLRMNAADIPNYTTLGKLVDAPELFTAYPDLKNIDVTLQTLEDGQNGGYNRQFDSIELSRSLKEKPEELLSSLIHEVQHAIQNREEFAKGASHAYWNRKLENGYDGRTAEAKREGAKLQEQYDAMKENDPQFIADMEELNAMTPTVPRGKIDFNTLEQIEPDPPEWEHFDARRDQLEERYGDRVWDYFSLRDSIDRNKKYGDRMPSDLYRDTAGEIEARDTAARRSLSAEERRNRRPDTGNEDTVFADGGSWISKSEQDSETSSIKEQIESSKFKLNAMEVVARASVPTDLPSKDAAAKWAESRLRSSGYKIDRQGYGEIYFSKKDMDKGLRYADTPEEKAALAVLPQVLKRGIEIGGHANHKGRTKQTITFAAPVELNGTRGNMAVVVNKNGNHYYAHRIVMPDGTAFKFSAEEKNNATQELSRGVTVSGSLADTTSVASGDSISRNGGNVKPKQRFSMEEPVEETKTLIAMHNMTEEKLRRTLDLGAWPSPSIAIVKAKDGHSNYGEYSAIFPRETIDPQADSRNHVYGGDAWTPTHDNALVEREVNYAARRAFDSRIGELSSQFAGGIFRGGSTLGKIGLENETRWEPGEIAEKLANYPEVQAAYLQSRGESLEPERRSKQFDRNYSNETIQRYLDSVGAQEVARLNVKLLTGGHLTEAEAALAKKAIREAYAEEHANFLNRRPESKEKRIDYYMQNNVTPNRVEDFVRSAEAFYESGGAGSETDKEATAAKMFEMIAPGGSWGDALRTVKDWVQPQLDGLLGERGVYNGKDAVTDSGRRSFAETHWDYTAENIVKAMNMASDKGANMYGVTPETLAATATPEFRSVDEMHAGEDRLRTESQDAHDRALRDLGVELDRVVDDLMRTTKHRHSNTFEEEQALSGIIAEAAKGKRTASAVKAAFRKEGYAISDGHAASILRLIERAASIPTGYYEAKPQRVVPFTESVAVVAPDNAPADLLSEMREAGMNVIEYAAGDDADRLEKINGIKDIRFSARDDILQRRRDRADSRLEQDIDESDLMAQNDAAERRVQSIRNTADEELADAQIAGQERSYEDAEREGKRGDYPSYSVEWKTKLERARAAMQNNIKPSGFDSYDEYIDAVDRQRAADRAERLRIKSKDEFEGTKALNELGIKIANSAGIYHNAEQLIANDRAAKSIQRATARAEQRLGATKREKVIARDIANGERAMSDIPGGVNKSRVLELADYYTAQKATKTGLLQQQRIEITDALREQAGELIGSEAPEINRKGLAKLFDPSKGLVLYHRTPQRIMRALFGWERGQKINEAVFEPVYENEQERKRFINRMFDEVRTFAGADGKKSALSKEESAFAQKLKEGRTVEELVEKSGDAEKIRKAAENLKKGSSMTDEAKEFGLDRQARDLARQYAEWLQTQDDYAAAKNIDRTKVENAIDKYTELYDKLYAAINDFLVAHGYEPIGFIKGYAPHFQTNEVNGKLESALKAIGVDLGSGVGKLPTSIAGLTKSFKPNKRYNPFFQHRRGTETDYDIVKGFETYVDYASDVLYHTDDIMRVRQMANYLRSTFAPEESKAEIDQMEAIRYAPADVKEEYLREKKKISRDSFLSYEDLTAMMEQYANEKYRSIEDATEFSDLVSWMDDYANKLAGKQLFEDRAMEREVGRETLNLAKKLNRMFARANVAGNLSSALNQSAQLPMIASELGKKYTWRAVADIARGKTTGMSAFRGESDFLTEKSGIDYIQSTTGDKAVELLFSPLEKVDTLVSTIAVRGKYRKELDAGKSPKEAMKAADRWARDIMGTRSKGSVPLTFQSKNFVAQMLNMFQVEAMNTLEHVTQDQFGPGFKEMAAKIGKDKAIKKLASESVAYLILAFLLNRLDEDTYGGTPAPFDFLGMALNAVASGNGLTSGNMLKMITDNVTEKLSGERLFGTDPDDMNDEFDLWSAAEDTVYNISNDLPYVRNAAALLGVGDQTLPMPDIIGALSKGGKALKNADSQGEFWAEVAKQLVGLAGDTLPGGRQAEKTLQGGDVILRGGSYQGYGDSKKLQYPVEPFLEDPWAALRAAFFGKNALSESRDYWAAGGNALSVSQTNLYQELVKNGLGRKKAYEAIENFNDATAGLKADTDENGKSINGSLKQKIIDAIDELPLNGKQKDLFYISQNYSEKDLDSLPWH